VVFLAGLHWTTVLISNRSNTQGFFDGTKAAVMTWYVYMLRCADGTLYTGVTTDLDRRVAEHNGEGRGDKGAKYTKARRPVQLVYQEESENRSEAQKREAALRTIPKAAKESLLLL
jgi:putative endonuclease